MCAAESVCAGATRQQLLALGDEFLEVVSQANTRHKRNGSGGVDLAPQLDALVRLLGQIDQRLTTLEQRLDQVHEAVHVQHTSKEYYTTIEAAKILGKRPYTVREWCRLERVHAEKALSGRGIDEEWRISHDELVRIQNEGLLPVKDDCSIRPAVRLPR
ncbi:MAG: helix-turn-helix domain-containing protein [Pirellulales bacterium]|nr:helix-turn-helix domain-containing protein [Pirellulales bacterium]